MIRKVTNIVLAGVGGQGSVLSTRIVAEAARRAGHTVVTSEVHGMSQRGGTVVTAVRYGEGSLAPVVPEGEAHLLVAFERLEAVRHLEMVRPGGLVVVGDQRITPLVEALKQADYPAELDEMARERGLDLELFPALSVAEELGNPKLAGVALLGVVAHHLDIPLDSWRGAIAETVPQHTVDANLAAFSTGQEWGVGPATISF